MSKKHPDYDLKFKGGCIALLIAANYPADPYALARVADHTGVSRRSLYRWWDTYKGNPDIGETVPPNDTDLAQVVRQEKIDLADMLEYVAVGLISEVKRRVDEKDLTDVSVPQLMTGAGIAIDKNRLVAGKSTENNETVLRIRYENDWRAPSTSNDELDG